MSCFQHKPSWKFIKINIRKRFPRPQNRDRVTGANLLFNIITHGKLISYCGVHRVVIIELKPLHFLCEGSRVFQIELFTHSQSINKTDILFVREKSQRPIESGNYVLSKEFLDSINKSYSHLRSSIYSFTTMLRSNRCSTRLRPSCPIFLWSPSDIKQNFSTTLTRSSAFCASQ